MKKYTNLTNSLIEKLNDRKGFDYWWDNIDTKTKKEIKEELKRTIQLWIENDWTD
jgi:hypothetical protein